MDTTTNSTVIEPIRDESLEAIIHKVRSNRNARPVRYDTLLKVQLELRKQRQSSLGSNIPFSRFLYPCGTTMNSGVVNLIEYLSIHTLHFWRTHQGNHLVFCKQFYELCFACPEYVTLDDVMLFATTLVHDEKSVFLYVMEQLLPLKYHDLAHSFVEDFPADFYGPAFEDAVFGAICVLLGVLKDPKEEEAQ